MSHFDLMEVKEGRRVIEHNSNSRSRRESSNTRILDSVQNASMVSDSDAIVGFDERDVDHPETGGLATPSLSTRQPPETQIRWWPELDRLLVARRPPPKPNPRFMRRNDPPEALAQMAKLLQPFNADVKSAHSSGPSRIGFAIAFFPSAAAGTLPLPAASE